MVMQTCNAPDQKMMLVLIIPLTARLVGISMQSTVLIAYARAINVRI